MPLFARQCLRLEFRLKSNLAISVNQVVSLKEKNGFLAVGPPGQAQSDKLPSDFQFWWGQNQEHKIDRFSAGRCRIILGWNPRNSRYDKCCPCVALCAERNRKRSVSSAQDTRARRRITTAACQRPRCLARELCPSCSEDPEESDQRPGRSLPPHLELKLTFLCEGRHHQTLGPWAAFRDDEWVGQIGNELTTVSVAVHQPAVEHHVRVQDLA